MLDIIYLCKFDQYHHCRVTLSFKRVSFIILYEFTFSSNFKNHWRMIYSVNPRIQCEYRKIRTKKNSVSGQFSRSVLPFIWCRLPEKSTRTFPSKLLQRPTISIFSTFAVPYSIPHYWYDNKTPLKNDQLLRKQELMLLQKNVTRHVFALPTTCCLIPNKTLFPNKRCFQISVLKLSTEEKRFTPKKKSHKTQTI